MHCHGSKGDGRCIPLNTKHGVRRNELEYEVQMAAQAMCLEEMYNCKIDKGYVYYGDDRRRIEVTIDDYYRDLVVEGSQKSQQDFGKSSDSYREKKCKVQRVLVK